ncbi:MAG: Eco57I restriction-modification methylase domain-containing protein [Cyclobacteriaceae bacterium]|nr:Eco57I restriction-modification methylase domain-containing protein [Cyclobacteriaceae bacterium]
MNLTNYFTKQEPLPLAVQRFFDAELSLQLTGKQDRPLQLVSLLGKEYKHLSRIHELYFVGGISDKTFHGQSETSTLEELRNGKYSSLLVFAVNLTDEKVTRGLLSDITRKLNQQSQGLPVTLLFFHGNNLSVATSERVPKKRGEGEKVGKVSLLKDIDINKPHAGHLRILKDLRISSVGKDAIRSFDDLYKQWRSVFDLKLLNQKFYEELFHWYLWATRLVRIPPRPAGETLTEESLRSIFVIRLITRLIFVWFVKEKKLIPDHLFDQREMEKLLNEFKAQSTKHGSYYKAILQNLFFATLNTPLRKEAKTEDEVRRFIDPSKKGNRGYSESYTDQTLYRYRSEFADPDHALSLFDTIPFLNGGLFECLDFPSNKEAKESERRYDGFSSVSEKQAFVPDVLFFGPEHELDITKDLDDDPKKAVKTRKIVSVRGIISILNSYKFTIAENTPLEEEVALDPELLGKVFENLLASYNPETKATARKQTGSFYTPREIVNYMVDESLKAYLLERIAGGPATMLELGRKQTQFFGNDSKKGQTALIAEAAPDQKHLARVTEKLNTLFQPGAEGNPFNEPETITLIEAISECKILDPACGSGAYPMGILHRMVDLLGKLDPNNVRWKQALLRLAEKDLETVQKQLVDPEIRKKAIENARHRIQYIKDSFANNRHEFDYTRKLFLIEHCIYGIDIQQIAVQIAKLRFFISLMVDQHVDDSRPNRNILSMPNLETKFVAANSLIRLDQNISSKKGSLGMAFMRSREVEQLEEQLKELRKEIFYTRKYGEKKKLKREEAALRDSLKAALIKSGLGESSAQQMASWNPFDPIHSAPFFDCETMFNFKTGFDIVIGNPPYYQIQKLKDAEKKQLEQQQFQTYSRTGDIYCLFYERGMNLLAPGRFLCYITSNKWMRTDYGELLRDFFTQRAKPIALIDFGMTLVFESATTLTNVILLTNQGRAKTIPMCRVRNDYSLDTSLKEYFGNNAAIIAHPGKESWVAYQKDEYSLIQKIESHGTRLSAWSLQINYGIKTGLNEAFIIDGETRKELISEDRSSKEVIRPMLRGEDVQPYVSTFNDNWLIATHNGYTTEAGKDIPPIPIKSLPAIKKFLHALEPKLSSRADQGDTPYHLRHCAYFEDFSKPKIIYPNMTNSLPFSYDEDDHYLCNDKAFIMTGEHLKYLVALLNSSLFKFAFKERFPELLGETREVRKVFFEKIPIKKPANSSQEKVFERLMDQVLKRKQADPEADTSALEQQIDQEVYRLYQLSAEEVSLIEHSLKPSGE